MERFLLATDLSRAQLRLPTNGGYGLCHIVDLRTEEVPLANYENSKYRSHEHGNLQSPEVSSNHAIDILHPADSSAICAFNWGVSWLAMVSSTRVCLPIGFEDLEPH